MHPRLAQVQAQAALGRARFEQSAGRLQPALLLRLAERRRALLAAPRVTPNPALLVAKVRAARAALDAGYRLVESLSPQAVLARGFALVLDGDGHLVKSSRDAAKAARLSLRFADGELAATPGAPRQGRLL
jgi:exodeoxyribonuclease VII large subunit